ncbi:MAG: hypothetical protein PHI31_04065 [Desulfuromonadaceae bacterium]|nr:hypothetical protein [Desulfuromonadaceae bacterium]
MFRTHDIIQLTPLVLIYLVHRRIARSGAFFLVLSHLPITIMHEAAHAVMALLFGVKPLGLSLWPQRENGRWRLGSVTARVTLISAVPTAFAPLIWLFVGAQLFDRRSAFNGESLFMTCGIYVAVYACIAAGIPSRQDVKVAFMHPLSLILWSAILIAAKYASG